MCMPATSEGQATISQRQRLTSPSFAFEAPFPRTRPEKDIAATSRRRIARQWLAWKVRLSPLARRGLTGKSPAVCVRCEDSLRDFTSRDCTLVHVVDLRAKPAKNRGCHGYKAHKVHPSWCTTYLHCLYLLLSRACECRGQVQPMAAIPAVRRLTTLPTLALCFTRCT